MQRAGQYEQFTDEQFDENFEQGYVEFDNDGSGQIEEKELEKFIKKYADLWDWMMLIERLTNKIYGQSQYLNSN